MSHDYRDSRPKARDRRRQRAWLMTAAEFGGDGATVPCFHCAAPTAHPEIDRYPICGHRGGRYVRGNIVPSCAPCNLGRCINKRCQVQQAEAA